jgi:DNA polymerase I-like protein with 3'-5' exonuclease and polymerase domains
MADNILFLGTYADKPYLPYLKGCVGSAKCFVITEQISTLYEIGTYCKQRGITGVITTSAYTLQKLLPSNTSTKLPSIDDYAGSLFKNAGLEYVILDPLAQLLSVPYGQFMAKRYISKLTAKAGWFPQSPQFNWCILTASNIEAEYDRVSSWELCAFDIETFQKNLAIRCIGFTFATLSNGYYITRSLVLPMDSEFACVWAGKFLSTRSAKIAQNGKYDINYLLRYGIVPNNYVWDTAALMHCWYSELPKDLASLSAFFVREAMYWKDLAESSDLETYYLYNAKDTHQTLLAFLGWIREAPSWARTNYIAEFPLQFPCIMAEMRGFKRDTERLEFARNEIRPKIANKLLLLQQSLGKPNFNPNSPKQVAQLLTVLGCKDIPSTEESDLQKAALRHPLNSFFINLILDIRGDRKLISTYLRTDEDITPKKPKGKKELNGRILFALNPHGTDTSRLASREHHFWCGLQIQNIPRGKTVKQTFVADDGFLWGESDLEQAESRDTAYITGDPALISAVSSGRDFHSVNASSFFGVPYEKIYSDLTKKTLDTPLRDLAKRVNHGANYNMGWFVLINTMGEDKIRQAQKLLGLPSKWTLREIAEHLLAVFTRTYPVVRVDYQNWIKLVVPRDRMLTGATGWTRYCFGEPGKSKQALNAYVAHCPQSLNAQVLNKAWMAVFYEVALPNQKDFKLIAQIHDSILFQYRVGREDLAQKVKQLMEIPVTIKDIKGVQRTFTVPAALKFGKKYWSEL